MKKTTLIFTLCAFALNLMAADLFYTDFATTPADLALKTGPSSITYTAAAAQLPVLGTNWEFGGLSSVKFASNTTPALSVTTMTIAEPVADNTPIGLYGRISLNATGDYFKVKGMKGPFTVTMYVATQTDPYTTPSTKVSIGAKDTTYTYDGLKLIQRKTFQYTGTDIVDVTIIQTKSGCNIFDLKISSGLTAIDEVSAENRSYMNGNRLELAANSDVVLYNLNGIKVAGATNCKSLSCEGIARGVYLAKIALNGKQSIQKIIIQ